MAQDNPFAKYAPAPASAGPLPSPPKEPKEPKEPKTTWRPLSPVEAQARGYPPGKSYQVSSDGKVEAISGAGEQPNDTKDTMRGANLDSIIGQINRVQELYDKGIRDETFWNGFGALDSVGPTAGQFDSAGQAIADQGLAAFRVPGVGAQSDMEAKQFALANTPQSGNWDAAIEEKLLTMRNRVDANRKALGLPPAQWTGLSENKQRDDKAVVAGAGGATPPPLAAPNYDPSDPTQRPIAGAGLDNGGGGAIQLGHDVNRTDNPALAGVRAEYAARLQRGDNADALIAWAHTAGVSPTADASIREQVQFRDKNPNVPIEQYDTSQLDDMATPLSSVENAINNAAQSTPGAFTIGAANTLTANSLDNIVGATGGNAERARLGIDQIAAANPKSTLAGNIAGGVMGALGVEGGLAMGGLRSGLGRSLAADSIYGAASGAGGTDYGENGAPATLSDRFLGAGKGAAVAAAGSGLGAATTRGLASAVSPTGGSVRSLYEAGVRPTLGQRMVNAGDGRGIKSMVGTAVNNIEEGLQSVPIVGSAIRGAREEARDQFQVGAFNQALNEIGSELPKGMRPGTEPHKFAQTAFNRAYDTARSGMTMIADGELATDLAKLAPEIGTLGPQAQDKLRAILENTVNSKVKNGVLRGDAYKNAVSDLGKHIARQRKGLMSDDQGLADVLEGVQSALDASARRHSNPEAVALLDAADAGYSKLVVIEDAARRRGGDTGTFTPTQFDAAVQNTSGGVRSKRYLRGDAQMEDYANAGKSLTDRLPNSGTTDRALLAGGAAGAAGYLEPTTLKVLGLIGLGYAPGVRKVTKAALAPGGPKAQAIAAQLRKRERLLSAAGASGAVQASIPSQ